MSKERFAELLRSESSAPDEKSSGLTLKQVLGKAWDEMAHVGAHGAHEVASALFTGNGFVMYPRAGQEGQVVEVPEHGLPEAQKEQEIGGREM